MASLPRAGLSHIPWEGIRSSNGGRNVVLDAEGRLVAVDRAENHRVMCKRDCKKGDFTHTFESSILHETV